IARPHHLRQKRRTQNLRAICRQTPTQTICRNLKTTPHRRNHGPPECYTLFYRGLNWLYAPHYRIHHLVEESEVGLRLGVCCHVEQSVAESKHLLTITKK